MGQHITLEAFEQAYLSPGLVSQQLIDEILAYYRALPGMGSTFNLTTAIYTDYMVQCVSAPTHCGED